MREAGGADSASGKVLKDFPRGGRDLLCQTLFCNVTLALPRQGAKFISHAHSVELGWVLGLLWPGEYSARSPRLPWAEPVSGLAASLAYLLEHSPLKHCLVKPSPTQ